MRSRLHALAHGVLVTYADLRLRQVNSWLAERLPGADQLPGRPVAEAFAELVERNLRVVLYRGPALRPMVSTAKAADFECKDTE